MKVKQEVVSTAAQCASFGFEHGFAAAVRCLRNLPGEVPKVLTSAIADVLDRLSDQARADFVKKIHVVTIETAPGGSGKMQ